jgi:hypothetical protein
LLLSPRDPLSAVYCGIASYAQFVGRNYDEAMRLAREGIRQRGDFVGAHRVLTAAAGMAGQPDADPARRRAGALFGRFPPRRLGVSSQRQRHDGRGRDCETETHRRDGTRGVGHGVTAALCRYACHTRKIRTPRGFRYEDIGDAAAFAIHIRRSGLRTNNAKSPVRISIPITNPKTGIQLPVAS